LPKIIPFIAGSLGAGAGGFLMGAINTWGGVEAGINSVYGPSGILATVLMTTPEGNVGIGVATYLGSLFSSYLAGAAAMFGLHWACKNVKFMKKFATKINYTLDN
jgi:N-acetylmuramic acid-specific PTS system IIC component